MLASFLIGTQFILILLTLIFYMWVKNKAYLYYAFHVFCFISYAAFCWARVDEDFKAAIFIGQTELYFHYLALFSTLALISTVNFIRFFLSLEDILPQWDKFMKWLGWIGKAIFVVVFLCFSTIFEAHHLAAKLLEFYVFCVSATCIAFIVPLLHNRKSINKYFTVGFLTLLFFISTALILRVAGIWYFHYFVGIAIFLESILFALALAEQQRSKDHERNKAIIELQKTKNKQRLNQLENERIKELEEVRSSFYTNITHEFRTPLTVIMGMAEHIKEKTENTELKKSSDFILRNSANVLKMINQLLDIAKSDTGNLSLELNRGDIMNYIHYISESFFTVASEKKIQLSFDAHPEILVVNFDADKLKHVIQNILSNAIKYTKPGGKIIVISEAYENEKITIRIKDTGVGIQDEDLPYIFERFYQAKNSSAGAGIGLALCKEYVELMNGTISATSKEGWGTEVIISLPIDRRTDFPLLPSNRKGLQPSNIDELKPVFLHTEVDASEQKPILLLVEDNIGVITYLQSLLKDDYQIIIAMNGQEGISLAIAEIPDIIITDVMMPEKNGYDLCLNLKEDVRTSHIPIIMLTAKADQASKINGLEVGADAYLTKPFERQELLLKLSNLLNTHKILFTKFSKHTSAGLDQHLDDRINNRKYHKEDQFIRRLNQIIDKLLDQGGLHEDKIAFDIGLSRNQLKRKLKALSNKTTKQYIRHRQLYKAQELLQSTDRSIAEVAYAVGFEDANYFIRVFKNEFGQPPGLMRKELLA